MKDIVTCGLFIHFVNFTIYKEMATQVDTLSMTRKQRTIVAS